MRLLQTQRSAQCEGLRVLGSGGHCGYRPSLCYSRDSHHLCASSSDKASCCQIDFYYANRLSTTTARFHVPYFPWPRLALELAHLSVHHIRIRPKDSSASFPKHGPFRYFSHRDRMKSSQVTLYFLGSSTPWRSYRLRLPSNLDPHPLCFRRSCGPNVASLVVQYHLE